jgi:uncharacterized protein
LQPFVIELRNLASGSSTFEWQAGCEFFETFGNPDILDASIAVSVQVNNLGLTLYVKAAIRGSVTVPCDRCLEGLQLPVEVSFEETYTPETMQLDLSQDVYDFVVLSLPMKRVHAEGLCNSETIKYLNVEQ